MAFGNQQRGPQPNGVGSLFSLEFPQSLRVYDSYPEAQKAVDFLSDQAFPVQNLCIVGTDLKSVERVLGRKTWKSVLLQGVTSGISIALFIGILLVLFVPNQNFLALIGVALLLGIAINVAFAAIAYAASGGSRDFNSVSQTVATKYEILCEHKVTAQARDLLDTMPGERARAFGA